jgi:hypothetical protein
VESQVATHVSLARPHPGIRTRAISALGPLTSLGGVVWAFAQPYRITLLHPRGQGFWWLVAEPPLFVIAVGAIFAYAVARPLLADLEGSDGASR